jgi:hypothetical protein
MHVKPIPIPNAPYVETVETLIGFQFPSDLSMPYRDIVFDWKTLEDLMDWGQSLRKRNDIVAELKGEYAIVSEVVRQYASRFSPSWV